MKNNKTLITIMLSLMLSQVVPAQQIEFSKIEQAAIHWLSSYPDYKISTTSEISDRTGSTVAYCFILNPCGYLIMTRDQNFPPVMAYSFSPNVSNIASEPNPLKEILLADIHNLDVHLNEFSLEYIEKNRKNWELLFNGNSQQRSFEQWPPAGSTGTGGWLETNWSQSAPYNNMCPRDNITGNRSLAGCPSVALAMIINYQKTLNGTHLDDTDDYFHNYAGRQYWIDDDAHEMEFPSFPELNELMDSMEVKLQTYIPPSIDEISALIFACGVAARQVYTSEGSGTFGLDQSYDAYLRFGFTDSELIPVSDTSFYTRMKSDIKESMPVHLAVLSSTGQGGHNLVVDGYNTDDYYHLNLGWGGSYNGWYLIPDEIPYNLTIMDAAVMNIGTTHVGIAAMPDEPVSKLEVFPNPSAGPINIILDVGHPMQVEINIHGVDGRFIDNIYIGELESGNQIFYWDGDIPSGTYYIFVKADHNILSRKVMMLR